MKPRDALHPLRAPATLRYHGWSLVTVCHHLWYSKLIQNKAKMPSDLPPVVSKRRSLTTQTQLAPPVPLLAKQRNPFRLQEIPRVPVTNSSPTAFVVLSGL